LFESNNIQIHIQSLSHTKLVAAVVLNCVFVAGATAFWVHFCKRSTRRWSSSHCN